MPNTSLRVHTFAAQFQFRPLIDISVSPLGSASVTVTVPLVAAVPVFETVTV
jgi:hypothetical protein